jgi:TonB-linked SusC/RagA family outer membrane protein
MKAKFYNYLKLDTFAKKFLLFTGMLLFSLSLTTTAQQVANYTGTVTDESGMPLPGVNVVEKGTSNGAITDLDGKFELKSENASLTLSFSMVGYLTFEGEYQIGDLVQISLIEDVVGLDEVVVIGYGTQKRSNVTSAISKLDSDQLAEVPVASVNEALQGRLAGVNVTNNSGSPGSGLKIVIRGVGTNGNAEPLYVVDGGIVDNVDNIEPYDIASVEVLKDAASAAIYGASAANGVVLITTKQGSERPAQVIYNMQIGSSSIGNYTQPMDAASYATWVNEANVGVEIPTNSPINTNWMDEIQENGMLQRHHLGFSGATEKGGYYISGSYLNQDGTVGGDKSKFERFTLRANITQQLRKWIQVGTYLTYNHYKLNAITEDSEFGGIISSGLMLDPLTPVTYDGALPGFAQDALDAGNTLVTDENGNYYGLSEYVKGEIANPLAQIAIDQGNVRADQILGNAFLKLGGDVWKGFSFTSRLNIEAGNVLFHEWYPTYWFSSERMNTQANIRDNTNRLFNWMWENYITYEHTFNEKHNLSVVLGTSAQQDTYKYLTTFSGPMFAEADNFAEHGPVEVDGKVSGNSEDNRKNSYFGRASYEYNGRYLVSAIIRRDGTSLLGTEQRWGNFPSVSAGWIISGEKFWNVDFINFMKIRASWGQNGMLSGLGPDQFRSLITTSGIKYPKPGGGFYTGAEPELLANPELTWATSEQIDIGLDMYMWANRLTLGIDLYQKKTKDLLTPGTPPPSVGNNAPFVNAGDVTNKGIEFELGLRKYEGKFNYDMNFNMTLMDNEVTFLNPLLDRVAGAQVGTGWTATWFELNQPMWYFRGYKTDGIFQNQAEINAYKDQNGGLAGYDPVPGDPIVVNTNGDDLINDEDQTYIGSPHPKFMWGAMFNFAYYGFDLRLFFQGVHGQDVLLGWNRYDRSTSNRPQFFFDERWTGEGSTNERPRAEQSSPYIYNSDLMVYKGGFVRIRQIQLGYTIPKSTMKNKVQNLRVYVSLDDYFTFTNYPGMDPEAGSGADNSQGIDRGLYPIPRKILFGLSFAF